MVNAEPRLERSESLPPLRIYHLLAWATVTAALISFSIQFERLARNGPPIKNPILTAILISSAVAIAGALTCTCFGAVWRLHRYRFPGDPGQWWLVAISGSMFGLLSWLIGSFAMPLIEEDWLEPFQVLRAMASAVVLFVFYMFVVFKHCDTNAWQLAIVSLVSIPLLTGPFILWAVMDDRRRKIPRHWSHFVGVTTVFLFWSTWLGAMLIA